MHLLTDPGISSVTGVIVDGGSPGVAAPVWGRADDGHAELEGHGLWSSVSAVVAAFRVGFAAVVRTDGVDDYNLVVVGAAELSTRCMGR